MSTVIGSCGNVSADNVYDILMKHWKTDKYNHGIEVDWITENEDGEPVKGPDGKVGWWNGSNPISTIEVEPRVVRTIVDYISNHSEKFWNQQDTFYKMNLEYKDFQLIADIINEKIVIPVPSKQHEIEHITFEQFKSIAKDQKEEGLVFLGCGDDLDQWVVGIPQLLNERKIAPNQFWKKLYQLTTTGGRVDLVFVFDHAANIDIGKMAIFRLKFGDCSWISDYIVNYEKQF